MLYPLTEVNKAVVSGVFVLGAIAALVFADYDPTFTEAVVVLTGAVFALIGVFMSKNHTIDDLSKAVSQLQGAALFVVGYFSTIEPGTVEKITVLMGALVSAYAVYRVQNGKSPSP